MDFQWNEKKNHLSKNCFCHPLKQSVMIFEDPLKLILYNIRWILSVIRIKDVLQSLNIACGNVNHSRSKGCLIFVSFQSTRRVFDSRKASGRELFSFPTFLGTTSFILLFLITDNYFNNNFGRGKCACRPALRSVHFRRPFY